MSGGPKSGWREDFARSWGVVTLEGDTPTGYRDRLWVTRCCRVKDDSGGTPSQMYRSPHVQRFLTFAAALELDHAIVSDKYGLHFPEQRMPYYDLGPWDLSREARRELGRLIGTQAEGRGHRDILFHNTSPMMSRPYLEILASSGLRVFFFTKLPVMKERR